LSIGSVKSLKEEKKSEKKTEKKSEKKSDKKSEKKLKKAMSKGKKNPNVAGNANALDIKTHYYKKFP